MYYCSCHWKHPPSSPHTHIPEIKDAGGIFPGTWGKSTCRAILSFQPFFDFGSCLKKNGDKAVLTEFGKGKKKEVFCSSRSIVLDSVCLIELPNQVNVTAFFWRTSLINITPPVTASAANSGQSAARRDENKKEAFFLSPTNYLTLCNPAVLLSSSSNDIMWLRHQNCEIK